MVMINWSWSSDFVNHSYDYRPNWTTRCPITIINEEKNANNNLVPAIGLYRTKNKNIT